MTRWRLSEQGKFGFRFKIHLNEIYHINRLKKTNKHKILSVGI